MKNAALPEFETLAVSDVVFRDELYPRVRKSPDLVQQYAEDISVLPPIEINQHRELIDGWHRWMAHRKAGAKSIATFTTETSSDGETFEIAVRRNSVGIRQLTTEDKQIIARRLYREANPNDRGWMKTHLAEILSMSYDTVNRWLSRIDKDTIEERNAAVLDLYLQCYTQDEIAERVGMRQPSVNELLSEICKCKIPIIPGIFSEMLLPDAAPIEKRQAAEAARLEKIIETNRANADHLSDFQVPIYNVWKQQEKTTGSADHFGNTEVRWVDNLLYLYTQPFDIVIDPFAGSGTTLDMCRKRFRRCWLSDRKPVDYRASEIRPLDITAALPDLRKRWSEVRLVYLDPPYWKQSEGRYSSDPEDLANMPLEEFHETLAHLIHGFSKKLTAGYIALVMSPTQFAAPDHRFTDHVATLLHTIKLPIQMRFSVPYESQQCNAQMVEWAQTNRECLVLTREIVVWKIDA